MIFKALSVAVTALLITGCGSTYKERKAPCQRPALSSAYGPEDAVPCGPLTPINQDRSNVLAAIDAALGR